MTTPSRINISDALRRMESEIRHERAGTQVSAGPFGELPESLKERLHAAALRIISQQAGPSPLVEMAGRPELGIPGVRQTYQVSTRAVPAVPGPGVVARPTVVPRPTSSLESERLFPSEEAIRSGEPREWRDIYRGFGRPAQMIPRKTEKPSEALFKFKEQRGLGSLGEPVPRAELRPSTAQNEVDVANLVIKGILGLGESYANLGVGLIAGMARGPLPPREFAQLSELQQIGEAAAFAPPLWLMGIGGHAAARALPGALRSSYGAWARQTAEAAFGRGTAAFERSIGARPALRMLPPGPRVVSPAALPEPLGVTLPKLTAPVVPAPEAPVAVLVSEKQVLDSVRMLRARSAGLTDGEAVARRMNDLEWIMVTDRASIVQRDWLRANAQTEEALLSIARRIEKEGVAQTPQGTWDWLRAQSGPAARLGAEVPVAARVGAEVPSPKLTAAPKGKQTQAVGADPNKKYDFEYALVELDDPIASHTDALTRNPEFPRPLQWRERDRATSRVQIDTIANRLQPDEVLLDTGYLDRGVPSVGSDLVVESGNGRILGMRLARSEVPERWGAYQERLRQVARDAGFTDDQIRQFRDPILVRSRMTPLTPEERVAFVRDANAPVTLRMSPYETALDDAARMTPEFVVNLEVGAEQSLDQALMSVANRGFVRSFLEMLPANERAALVDQQGVLNTAGLQRLKAALFAKTYPGEAGEMLTRTFFESASPDIRMIEQGMMASLPRMAVAENLIRAGQRDAALSLAGDWARTVRVYAHLKQSGTSVESHLIQIPLFERQLTPFQERLLVWLGKNSRSAKVIRRTLSEYSDNVITQAQFARKTLPGMEVAHGGKEGLFEAAFNRVAAEASAKKGAPSLFGFAEGEAALGRAPEAGGEGLGFGGGRPPSIGGGAGGIRVNPPRPEPSAGSAWGKVRAASAQPRRKWLPDLNDLWWRFRESWNDIARAEVMQMRLGRVEAVGEATDFVTQATVHPNAATKGAGRFLWTWNQLEEAFPGLSFDIMQDYYKIRHFQELLRYHPRHKLPGGLSGADELQAALWEMQKAVGPDEFARIHQAGRQMADVFKGELYAKVNKVITKEFADQLSSMYQWYFPLNYREVGGRLRVGGRPWKSVSMTTTGIYRLGEIGSTGVIQSPFEAMAHYMMFNEQLLSKYRTLKIFVKMLERAEARSLVPVGSVRRVSTVRPVANVEGELIFWPRKGGVEGAVTFLDEGGQVTYELADWALREIDLLMKTGRDTASAFASALNSISRVTFTKYSPEFMVRNIMRDMVTAYATEGVLPTDSVPRMIKNLKAIEKDVERMVYMMSGGYHPRFTGRTALEIVTDRIRESGGKVARTPMQALRFVRDAIPRINEAIEQGPRRFVFERELDRLMPGWRKLNPNVVARSYEAALAAAKAIEVTIDFARRGWLTRALDPYLIFFGASTQGLMLPFRAMMKNPAVRWRLAALMTGSMAIDAYNMSYPEYFDIDDSSRWGSKIIMLPSKELKPDGTPKPNYIAMVPRTSEWALFFGPMTYALERFWQKNPADFGHFTLTLLPQVSPISEVPSPVILQEITEQIANYDFYRSRPIVSPELASQPRPMQYDPWTSRTSQNVAGLLGLSPVRVEHAIGGILGGAGYAGLNTTDYIMNTFMPNRIDTQVAVMVEAYEALETPVERREFRTNLTPEAREELDSALRQPDETLPIVSSMGRALMPGHYGQIRRTREGVAERVTGLSPEDTRRVGDDIRKVSDKLLNDQHVLDRAFDSGEIPGPAWLDGRAALGAQYGGAIELLGVTVPRAAQVQADEAVKKAYYDAVNGWAEGIVDTGDRGRFLAATWYAIGPDEYLPGLPDWRAMQKARDEFKVALSQDDKELLEEEIRSRATPVEERWLDAQEVLEPYFDIALTIIGDDKVLLAQYEEYETIRKYDSHAATVYKNTRGRTELRKALIRINREKERMQRKDIYLDFLAYLWLGSAPTHASLRRDIDSALREAGGVLAEPIESYLSPTTLQALEDAR